MAIQGVPQNSALAEILRKRKPVNDDKLRLAEAEANTSGKPLQTVLVENGLMTRDSMLALLSEEWKVGIARIIGPDCPDIDPETVKIIPESVARRLLALPFEKGESSLSVAMSNPLDMFAIEDLQTRTGLEIKPYLGLPQDIIAAIDAVHGKASGPLAARTRRLSEREEDRFEDKYGLPDAPFIESLQEERRAEVDSADKYGLPDAPRIDAVPEVERMVNAIILAGLEAGASAVHLEPQESPDGKSNKVLVRLRVDGVLRPGPFCIPWPYRSAIMAKLKIMSGSMNICERQRPQSGRIRVLVKGDQDRPLELSVEIAPTLHGEACVMRFLDCGSPPPELGTLGLLPATEARLLDILGRAGRSGGRGLVLVSGPGSSGKTSALYAFLNHLRAPGNKVVMADYPNARSLADVTQMTLNPDAGFGGSHILRTALRMDADVVMIPEIMDAETARLACETALAGRMVFSGMHAADAPSAVGRLLDMGVPPYLAADALAAVLALRLKRRLCLECKAPRDPAEPEIAAFRAHQVELGGRAKLHRAEGCALCGKSGFKGRLGLHELLVVTDALRSLIVQGAAVGMIRGQALKDGMRTLAQDGLEKAKLGLTTVGEILGTR